MSAKKAGKDPKGKKVSERGVQAQTAKTAPAIGFQLVPITSLKANPANPRVLRDEKFAKLKQSLVDFPDMLNKRPIVCNACGAAFTSRKSCASRSPKFCSKACYAQSLRKPKRVNVPAPSRKGVPLSAEWRKALSEGRKASPKCKGENLYNWKGGAATQVERSRQYNRNRWQRIRGGGPMPVPYLSAVRRAQRDRCFYCEQPLRAGRATHIEHLTPISRGGTNEWDNLVYSCQPCNNSKRNKTLMEFVIHRMQPSLLDKSILIQCAAKRAADSLVPHHASAVN